MSHDQLSSQVGGDPHITEPVDIMGVVDLGELSAPEDGPPPAPPPSWRERLQSIPWSRLATVAVVVVVACFVTWQVGVQRGRTEGTRQEQQREAQSRQSRVDGAGGGAARAPVQFGPTGPVAATGPAGGLEGVYVVQTSSAAGAALVLTNRASTSRLVTFASDEADGFRLVEAPAKAHVLGPGRSISIFLTVKVLRCSGAGRLTNWADRVSMHVVALVPGVEVSGYRPEAQTGMSDVLLAPLGAAVQRACP